MSDSRPWRTVGGGAARESSSSIDGPVIISCSSSLGSQLRALPPLGALRSPLFGALLAGMRLDVCSLMPFGMPFGGAGTGSTRGGRPSDLTVGRTRLTKSVDIFALGCLYFYTLTGGEHPYGGPFERESNILKDAKDLGALDKFGEEGEEAKDLIGRMLAPDPKAR